MPTLLQYARKRLKAQAKSSWSSAKQYERTYSEQPAEAYEPVVIGRGGVNLG